MSIGDSSGVTFPGFCTIPPITLLSGTGEDDLSKKELTDCWNKGSLGASRVDREGFERVWRQVQESYYQDIVDEAQDRTLVRKRKRGSANKPEAPVAPATTVTPSTPTVGANVSPEILKESVSKLKDEDFSAMFDQMANMGPAEEARMKAMGVDPAMMKKSAAMMKNNPLLRRAATAMMKNTPTDQLVKASQQAQEKMANMTDEEKQRMMDSLK
uniref:Uncharacterized protein n=1 Tax=Entomoneis paludosa TaxID=265537 RepID=A0A7S2V8G4_9STRA